MITTVDVQNILRTTPLVQEIKKLAEKENSYDSLLNNTVIKSIIENEKGFRYFVAELPEPENNSNDWKEDKPFLNLIEVINTQIIRQLTEGEHNMIGAESAVATKVIATKTAIVMGLGVIGLIGIGLYAYRCQQNKGNQKDDSFLGKVKKVKEEVTAGFDSSTTPRQVSSSPPVQKTAPIYKPHVLLLIVDANQLDKGLELKLDKPIPKTEAEKVIARATFGYFFVDADPEGLKILESIAFLDEPINYETTEKVFLELSLSANPDMAIKKPNRLDIIKAMESNKDVKVKTLKKMKVTDAIKAFRSII